MAIVENVTPEFITNTEYENKKILVDINSPVAIPTGDLFIVASFENRIATANGASSTTLVKVDSAGTDSVIADGDSLAGYRIAYKPVADIAVGDAIAGALEYWSSI